MATIKDLDGKLFGMGVHPDLGCVGACTWNMYSCCSPVVGKMKVTEDTVSVGDVTLCWGLFPMSPIPCCLCCGVGPLKPEWRMVRDPTDSTKWVSGTSGVLPYGCCNSMTKHPGDNFVVDAAHDGSQAKPITMIAGKNMMNPPCFWNKKFGIFAEVFDRSGAVTSRGGGPPVTAEAMARN